MLIIKSEIVIFESFKLPAQEVIWKRFDRTPNWVRFECALTHNMLITMIIMIILMMIVIINDDQMINLCTPLENLD